MATTLPQLAQNDDPRMKAGVLPQLAPIVPVDQAQQLHGLQTLPPPEASLPTAAPQTMPPALRPVVNNPQHDILNKPVEGPLTGGFWHKLGQVASRIGQAGAATFIPGAYMAESMIPGTMLYNQAQHEQAADSIKRSQDQAMQNSEIRLREAQTRGAEASADKAGKTDLAQDYADAVEAAQREGRDPASDPAVMQLSDAITQLQKPSTKTPEESTYASLIQQGIKPIDALSQIYGAKGDQKVVPLPEQYLDALRTGDKAKAGLIKQVIHDTQVAPKVEVKNSGGSGAKEGNARADRSYQYNQGELDKLTNPISQLTMRMGRLQDTLAQNNQQSDALVAPELLTVMAGGQGSGLRMNEAEIARVIGGATAWTSLQTAINRWSTNPNSARFTPVQHQQIRMLIRAVSDKLNAKQEALNKAAGDLINTEDPTEHRRIVQQARQTLNSIDEGRGAAPQGFEWKANGSKGPGYYRVKSK